MLGIGLDWPTQVDARTRNQLLEINRAFYEAHAEAFDRSRGDRPWPGWQRRLEICGENGSIVLENDHLVRWEFRTAAPGDDAIRDAKLDAALGSGASRPDAISTVGHQRQLQDLVDALRAGRAPLIDGSEGRKAVALVRAIYDSAGSGMPVKVV